MDNSRIRYRLDLDPSDFMRRAREAQAALNALKAEASGVIYPQRRGGKEPENSPFPSVSADKANYVLPIPRHIQLPADPGFSKKLGYILPPPPRSGIVPPDLSKLEHGGRKQLTAYVQAGASALTDNLPAKRLRKFGAEALAASRGMTALRESLSKLRVVRVLNYDSIPKRLMPGTIPHAPKLLGPGSIPKLITDGTIPHEPKLLGPGSIPKLYAWPPPKPKPADVFIPSGIASSVKSPGSTPKSYAWPPPKPKPAEVFNSASIRSSLKYAAGEIAGNTGWMGIGTEVRVPGQKIPFYRDRPTAMRPSTAVEFKKNYSNIYPVTALDAFRGEIAPASLGMNEAARGPRAGRPGAWDRILRPPSASVIGSTSVGGSIGSGLRSLGAGAASFMTAQRSMPNLFTLRNMIGGYAGAKLIGNISESGEKIEYLRRMYEVFYGDAKRGAKELEQTLELARLSPFDALEIADQRRLLRAFGIDSQRILTNITNTAAATDKPLQQITISLGRLASGVYGEGFEGLRRIGISQRELFEEGLEFNPRSQQFMGTPEQAINAVMRIMERRFPDMAESMMTTWKGQKENLHDAWTQAIAPLGELMHRTLMRPMESFSQNLVELRDGFLSGSKALGTFLSDLEKLVKLPSSYKIDSITGTDEIDKLMGDDPSDTLTKLETQRGMWESPPEPFEEGSVMDNLGNFGKDVISGSVAVGAGLAMQMSGKSREEQARVAASAEQATAEFLFQGKSTKWLMDEKARMDKAAARAKSGDVPKPIKMWGLETPVPDTGGEWTDQTDSPKYKAIEKMLKEREEFNKRLDELKPELQSREREALAKEVQEGVKSREASRRVLRQYDINKLRKFDKEIARREANLQGLQDSVAEYDTRAGIFAGGKEWEWGRDQIKKQQAELAELRRRRQIIESRIKSPVAYDQYLRAEKERTAQKNIEKDNRASERYSERESINVSNSQVNNNYFYGSQPGVLTGAAQLYGGM